MPRKNDLLILMTGAILAFTADEPLEMAAAVVIVMLQFLRMDKMIMEGE